MTEKQWQSLENGLKSWADETSAARTSAGVEHALRATLASRRTVREAARPEPLWRWALAASLLAIGLLSAVLLVTRPKEAQPPVTAAAESYTPWFVEGVAASAATRGQVVRVRVSPGTAASFGVHPLPGTSLRTVEADVFVAEDGVTRAIRFVR